jgi:hypothetical protein
MTQMKNRQSLKQQQTNANYMLWSKSAVAQHWALKSLHANRRLVYALMLLPASLLLSACNHLPTQPCEPLPPTTRPVPLYQIPSVSYSLQAQTDIETWRLKLTNAASTSSSK